MCGHLKARCTYPNREESDMNERVEGIIEKLLEARVALAQVAGASRPDDVWSADIAAVMEDLRWIARTCWKLVDAVEE